MSEPILTDGIIKLELLINGEKIVCFNKHLQDGDITPETNQEAYAHCLNKCSQSIFEALRKKDDNLEFIYF